MKHLDAMLDLADKEFEVFEKNGKFRSRDEIDTVYKLVDIVKDVYCIWKYEDEESGMSKESYDDYRMSYDGDSYAGRRNAKRDSMGRYSSDSGKDEYLRQLRSMAESAPDDRTRNSISRMVREMERA